MKIFYLTYFLTLGGVENHIMDLIEYCSDTTVQHVIVYAGGEMRQELKPRVAHIEKEGRVSYQPFIKKNFEQLIKQEKPDVIHVTEKKLYPAAYMAFLKCGVPCVPVWHTPPFSPLPKDFKPVHDNVMDAMKSSGIKQYGVSSYATNYYKGYFDYPNIETIWNGRDVNHFHFSPENREKIRADYEIPSDAFVIGGVGRIVLWWKRHDWIVQAVERLHAQGFKNVYALIVGDGKDFEKLKEVAGKSPVKDFIKLTGGKHDVAPYYSAFDMYAHPSKRECHPLVCVEAGLCGLPQVLCIPYNPLRAEEDGYDIVRNGYNGLVVNAYNKEAFFKAVEEMVKNDELRARCASVARQSVEDLSVQNMAQRYYEIFKQTISDAKKHYDCAEQS